MLSPMIGRPRKTKLSREFRDWLVSVRVERGLSQNQAAIEAGVSQGELGNFERGVRDASDDFLMKLARALGVDEVEMLTRAAKDRVEQSRLPAVAPVDGVRLVATLPDGSRHAFNGPIAGLRIVLGLPGDTDLDGIVAHLGSTGATVTVEPLPSSWRPPALIVAPAQEPPAPAYSARPCKHLTGDDPKIRPLTDRDWRYVDELLAITGGDLDQVSLYKGAPVWYLDEDERLAALRQQVRELKPQAKRKKEAG